MLQIIKLSVQDTISEDGRHVGFVMGVVNTTGMTYSIDISQDLYETLLSIIAHQGQAPRAMAQPPSDVAHFDPKQIDSMSLDEMQSVLSELQGSSPLSELIQSGGGPEPVPLEENVADLFSIVRGEDDPDDEGERTEEEEDPIGVGRGMGQL